MCGIITKTWHKPIDGHDASTEIKKMYNKQKHRGSEGSGCVIIKNDYSVVVSQDTDVADTISKITDVDYVDTVVFHHRYPTSTDNVSPCSHPIHVSHKELVHDYYVIHNGVISNTVKLRTQHMSEGYTYSTEHVKNDKTEYVFSNGDVYENEYKQTYWNDSESVAIEFARLCDGLTTNIDNVTGSFALIAVRVNKKTKKAVSIVYYRNQGSPTTIGSGLLELSSEGNTESTIAGVLYEFDLKSRKQSKCVITEYPQMTNKVGFVPNTYPHWNDDTGEYVSDRTPSDDDDTFSDDEYLDYLWEQYALEKDKNIKKEIYREIEEIENRYYLTK